jgi:hypothetical protein
MTRLCAALAVAATFVAFAVVGGDAGAHSEQGQLALTAEARPSSSTSAAPLGRVRRRRSVGR